MKIQGIGIPFFTASEWEKARGVMEDGHTFHGAYGDFVAKVQAKQAELAKQGIATIRVHIEVDRFVQWCRGSGRAVDSKSRAEYAAVAAAQQDSGRKTT